MMVTQTVWQPTPAPIILPGSKHWDRIIRCLGSSILFPGLAAVRREAIGLATGPPNAPKAGYVAWYDAKVGVYKDLGTTPCAHLDTVEQWNDQSGNGYHLLQTTSAFRPVFGGATIGGFDVIKAQDQYLRVAGPALTQPFHIFCVFLPSTIDSSDRPYFTGTGSATVGRFGIRSTNAFLIRSSTILEGASNSAQPVAAHTMAALFNGASSVLMVSGKTTLTGDAGTDGATWGSVFLDGSNNVFGYLSFAEIIVYNSALSDTDRDNNLAYLAAKWGL